MNNVPDSAAGRPWYREPWPWILIAIPLLAVIASAITFWLAVTRPDYLVLDASEYLQIKAQLQAEPPAAALSAEQTARDTDGDR